MELSITILLSSPFILLGCAIALDMVMGEPSFLWSRLPHPVVLFGKAISALEAKGNHRRYRGRQRRLFGLGAIIIWILLASFVGLLLSSGLSLLPLIVHFTIETILVGILLAGRSLYDHIKAVMMPLKAGDLASARQAVGMIVGRDTTSLSKDEVARAAIETGAENLSDGVIAPALWYLIGGLPLLLAYKMINTADSMVGYKSSRYYAFGWGAAIIDDVVNFFPARLSALLIMLVALFSGRASTAYDVMRRDADKHASPNAGYPESAMAGALGIRLGGPRQYHGKWLDLPSMNAEGREALGADDIDASLRILWLCLGLTSVMCFAFALAF